MSAPSIIGLIPARAGSKRIRGKNVRELGGHPLVAYSIASASESGVFAAVLVSTDSSEIADIARHYGAEAPFLRPAQFAGDKSPDIEWIRYTLLTLGESGRHYDAFSILRPTSPFRLPSTIRRAWQQFQEAPTADSLRAIELCTQHPGKMWRMDQPFMRPLLDDRGSNPPWHSTPYQALPIVYVQNASLEIAWTRVPLTLGTIAGSRIMPFLMEGWEGFDINRTEDWWLAEILLERGLVKLPEVKVPRWQST